MGNKRRISLNKKILLIALSFMVISQIVYLYIDIRSFEKSYVEIIKSNLYVVGTSIKNNLDGILDKGIPINKLIGLEPYFNETLSDAPNLAFIAVYDEAGRCLYYSDRNGFIEGSTADKTDKDLIKSESGSRFVLNFPLQSAGGGIKGKLITGIDQKVISKQIRSVIMDTATVILISILATIDFLFFIVALTIEVPLKRVAEDISLANNLEQAGLQIKRTGIGFFDQELDRFDRYRYDFIVKWLRFKELFFSFGRTLQYQNIKNHYQPVKEIESIISRFSFQRKEHNGPAIIGLPVLIRPALFLFVFAEALSISFLPLYAEEIYRPLWGFGKEVIIGLPISAFMLFTALSFPVGGALSDTIGYRKSFAFGALITATGLFLTGTANDIIYLILYRCIVGAGFGIVFITAQNYIVSTTSMSNRAEGMAIFLSAFYGGTLCGSAIGGMVAERIGYRILFYSGAIIALAAVFFIYFFIFDQDRTGKNSEDGKLFKQFKSFLPFPRDIIKLLSNRNFAALTFLQSIPNKICLIGFVYYIAPTFFKKFGFKPVRYRQIYNGLQFDDDSFQSGGFKIDRQVFVRKAFCILGRDFIRSFAYTFFLLQQCMDDSNRDIISRAVTYHFSVESGKTGFPA
uniref:Major facilitator superfamily (MFS) profile domain-containing protein n=1 Tax=uncultured Desulfobacterium sp. TaxID=201089 RepID=E1YCM0_9BACT|nr:hypothetical protein N47_G36380 [uncultured Desulfobacterium sp.]